MAPKWFDYNKIIMDNHHQLCLQETKKQWYQSLSKIKHASRRIFLYLSFVSGFSNMIFKSREKVIWKYCIYVFVNILRYTNSILTLNTNMDIFVYIYVLHYNCLRKSLIISLVCYFPSIENNWNKACTIYVWALFGCNDWHTASLLEFFQINNNEYR